jgi:hypothetical protein
MYTDARPSTFGPLLANWPFLLPLSVKVYRFWPSAVSNLAFSSAIALLNMLLSTFALVYDVKVYAALGFRADVD